MTCVCQKNQGRAAIPNKQRLKFQPAGRSAAKGEAANARTYSCGFPLGGCFLLLRRVAPPERTLLSSRKRVGYAVFPC